MAFPVEEIAVRMRSIVSGAVISLATVAVSGTPNVSFAQSDTLTITGTGSFAGNPLFNRSVTITEAEEPLGRSIDLPGTTTISIPGTTVIEPFSDNIIITPSGGAPAVSINLSSDANTTPDTGAESQTITLFSFNSDAPPPLSDTLTVAGQTATIDEPNGEPANVTLHFPGLTMNIPEGPGASSDLLTINAFDVELQSLGGDTSAILGEGESGTITITVVSDFAVPEPASLAILGFSLFGMGAVYRRFRK